jgi:hypothetical protein
MLGTLPEKLTVKGPETPPETLEILPQALDRRALSSCEL